MPAETQSSGYFACCGCSGAPPLPKDGEIHENTAVTNPCFEGDSLETFKDLRAPVQVSNKEKLNAPDDYLANLNTDLEAVEVRVVGDVEPLRAVFRCAAVSEQSAHFRSRPLGLTFEPGSLPLKISAVTGQAAAMGVRPGWIVKAVAGVDATAADRTSSQIFEDLKRSSQPLPVVQNQSTLEVIFQCGGRSKAVLFARRPLGLSIGRSLPVKVTGATGHAAELGVEVGWSITSVDGKLVSDAKLSFPEVEEMLKAASQCLPLDDSPAGVPMVFKDLCGQPHRVVFEERPLGVRFSRKGLPMVVSGMSPLAEHLGIKEGWTLASAAGKDVTSDSLTYEDVESMLKRSVAPLSSQAKPKLDITFLPNTMDKVVHFTRRPLDVCFTEGSPMRVLKATGHSKECGVQPDWTLQGIAGQDVSNLTHKLTLQLWKEAESRLPLEAPPAPELPKARRHPRIEDGSSDAEEMRNQHEASGALLRLHNFLKRILGLLMCPLLLSNPRPTPVRPGRPDSVLPY